MIKLLIGMCGSIGLLSFTPQIAFWRKIITTEIQIIMSIGAQNMIPPTTVSLATGCKVYTDIFPVDPIRTVATHVELSDWADTLIVAPCSANTLSRLASGACSDLLSLTFLSAIQPRGIVPNMHPRMWRATPTQRNVDILRSDGWHFYGFENKNSIDLPNPSPESLVNFISHLMEKQ